jgi:hypothetical protein
MLDGGDVCVVRYSRCWRLLDVAVLTIFEKLLDMWRRNCPSSFVDHKFRYARLFAPCHYALDRAVAHVTTNNVDQSMHA